MRDIRPYCGRLAFFGLLALCLPSGIGAVELGEAQTMFRRGNYEACSEAASEAIQQGQWSETWRLLKIEADLASGRDRQALLSLEQALERYRYSIPLRLLARDVYLRNALPDKADSMLNEIDAMARLRPWNYTSRENRIAIGRFFLLRGIDPKQVLEYFYDGVKKDNPTFVDAFTATADLALEKEDYGLAVESLETALRLDAEDPGLHYRLARAYAPSDPERAANALNTALKLNPRHVDSLLVVADKSLDAEKYDKARAALEEVLNIHPEHPLACAYLAVLAHMQGNESEERYWRDVALCVWTDNPEVDHVIGRELSRHYRFAEGAAHQRQALELDPDYAPAKIQLSQDLLRLGDEVEGWQLAREVGESDGYNVVAHNLVTLQKNLSSFRTLEKDGLVVRMDATEAEIYGRQVLDLLTRAREELAAKYEMELAELIVVEIFPQQSDFAIRTFGLPGGAGFLGVCFGQVITANSPASQGESPTNWQSVLWHEFCHVVTLQKTRNKMPRWLSEGISVYEERLKDPSWGQSMNPQYRELILNEGLTPVSSLSAAFLDPPSPMHLQFAYFESSMVVEFLVEEFGSETLNRILTDLGVGMPINDSLQRYAGSLEWLDDAFAKYAKRCAERLAPNADWERPKDTSKGPFGGGPFEGGPQDWADWLGDHPNNIWALKQLAKQQVAASQWNEAEETLQKSIELYPEDAGGDSAYRLLAVVYRQSGKPDEELGVLERLAALDSDAVDVFQRLCSLHEAKEDWEGVARYAERSLHVNPLLPAPQQSFAEANERLERPLPAIDAYRALLAMDPVDPAEMHYRIGKLLQQTGQLDEAHRHVLQALEEAPRYRAAHRTLLELLDARKPEPEPVGLGVTAR